MIESTRNHVGVPLACADCRLNGQCHACPNTAWLLFLLFAIALVALVALSVYLSKKRLNLAGLGIGVVRGCLV